MGALSNRVVEFEKKAKPYAFLLQSILWALFGLLAVAALVGFAINPTQPKPDWAPDAAHTASKLLRDVSLAGWLLFVVGLFVTLSAILMMTVVVQTNKAKRFRAQSPQMIGYMQKFTREFIERNKILLNRAVDCAGSKQAFVFNEHYYFDDMCTDIANLFEKLTGHPCHCTIKKFEKGMFVSTRARDKLEHNQHRGKIENDRGPFEYTKDSGFKKIIDDEKAGYFICNDLGSYENYENSSTDWRRNFNSTFIYPAQMNASARINRGNCIGFITLDSLHANFDEELTKNLLGFFCLQAQEFLIIIASATDSNSKGDNQ